MDNFDEQPRNLSSYQIWADNIFWNAKRMLDWHMIDFTVVPDPSSPDYITNKKIPIGIFSQGLISVNGSVINPDNNGVYNLIITPPITSVPQPVLPPSSTPPAPTFSIVEDDAGIMSWVDITNGIKPIVNKGIMTGDYIKMFQSQALDDATNFLLTCTSASVNSAIVATESLVNAGSLRKGYRINIDWQGVYSAPLTFTNNAYSKVLYQLIVDGATIRQRPIYCPYVPITDSMNAIGSLSAILQLDPGVHTIQLIIYSQISGITTSYIYTHQNTHIDISEIGGIL